MLAQTKGIVLHTVKYGDNSIIATVYTEKFGRQAYIINSAKGRKAKNKASLLQPLFLLDMVVYQKSTREVQRLKEFKNYVTFQSIPFDIKKSAQAIFIAEVLYKLLREEGSDPELYNFCENAIKYLDLAEKGISNFHLFFLSRLTQFVGVFPRIQSSGTGSFFDLRKGVTTHTEPAHPMFMGKYETQLFGQLINMSISGLNSFRVERESRMPLLIKIVQYYRHHFDAMGEINSLYVLKEVFAG